VEAQGLSERGDESVLRDWLNVLSRQKWIVVLAVTVVPLVAALASHRQQHLYQASATVLVNQQNATAQALNLSAAVTAPPDRYAGTQAKLARVGTVATMAVNAAKLPGHTTPALLANSSVSADPLADLLTFSVTDPSPTVAMKLVNAYAQQFTRYRHKLDSAALSAAITDARRKLKALVGSGEGSSQLSRRLAATEGDLEELQTLQAAGSSAAMVGPALSASLVQPRTKRNVLLGVIVGLALGIALAFIREALDTRVRYAEELRARLGLPLLGQVPKPDRRLAESRQLATLTKRTSSSSEAFRILTNKLEMLQLEYHVGSIVITSPIEDADKSTTAANLAVSVAQSGRHVILVDLNLRDPTVHELFGLDNRLGFTHVAMGGVEVADALRLGGVYTSGTEAGVLEVVTAGYRPRDPGELLLSNRVPEALTLLRERCDLLLIDTPPVLAVGDAMTIAKHTDAVILVARVNRVRRESLVETRHVLDACPARKLGVIATGGYATERSSYPQRVSTALTRARSDYAEREGRVAAPRGGPASKPATKLLPAISALVGSAHGRGDSARARHNGHGSETPSGARAADRREREDGSQQVRDA
jgi:capsular exopolysaccharide synthesis family protein